jgi:hypothetical protein
MIKEINNTKGKERRDKKKLNIKKRIENSKSNYL